MASYDGFSFDDDDDQPQSGQDLVKNLRNALKAEQRKAKELADQLANISQQTRSRSLADVLAEKGLPEKVAKLYPADADASAEAVDAWLAEYGEVFGIEKRDTEAAPEAQQAARQIAAMTASAPVPSTSSSMDAAIAAIAAARSPEELAAAYQQLGMKP